MIKVVITGGIGSGKSSVCKYIENYLNIPVYYVDLEAKKIMTSTLKSQVIEIFGDDSYINGKINKEKFNKLLFNNKKELEKMNSIVKPAMEKDLNMWLKDKKDLIVVENALVFDHKQENKYDYIVNVYVDEEIRIDRVCERDNLSPEIVKGKIRNQLSDEYKNKLSDFVIHNNKDVEHLKKEIEQIIEQIKTN